VSIETIIADDEVVEIGEVEELLVRKSPSTDSAASTKSCRAPRRALQSGAAWSLNAQVSLRDEAFVRWRTTTARVASCSSNRLSW